MSEKDILAAIQKGAHIAGEEARKHLGADIAAARVAAMTPDTLNVEQAAGPDAPVAVEAISGATDIDATNVRSLRKRARRDKGAKLTTSSATPVAVAVQPVPEPASEPAVAADVKMPEERQAREFVESIPDGEEIILVSRKGRREHYRRDGADLVKKNGDIVTLPAWKKHRDGWTRSQEGVRIEPVPQKKQLPQREGETVELMDPVAMELFEYVRRGDGYTLVGSDGKDAESITADELERLLRTGKLSFTEQVASLDNEEHEQGDPLEETELLPHDSPEGKAILEQFGLNPESVRTPAEIEQNAIEEKIAALKNEVGEMRAKYAKEDYESANNWKKLAAFFRLKKSDEKNADTAYWKAHYNNKLIDLKNLELEKIKSSDMTEAAAKKEIIGLLEYYKKSEPLQLHADRTQVKAEHQGWPGKVMGAFEAIGRKYNQRSRKEKYVTAAALFGLAGATGGASLMAGRFFSSAGTFVGLDAFFEGMAEKKMNKRATAEAQEAMSVWEGRREEGRLSKVDIEHFSELLQNDIFASDKRLQDQKRSALFRKSLAAAMAAGVAFGLPGWLFNELGGRELAGATAGFVMKDLGGREAADLAKEQLSDAFHGTDMAHPEMVIHPHSLGETLAPEPQTAEATGMTDEQSRALAASSAEARPDFINEFVTKDIVVRQGDSVWKIADRLAKELGLEEKSPQSTHFIDAIKDKYGDVLLKEGETINFSSQGIDKGFIENALGDAKALTAEQAASIAAHDVKIEEFAAAHPDVTLTDESVDAILREPDGADVPADAVSETGGDDGGLVASTAVAHEKGWQPADIQYDRDIVLGAKYDVTAYTEFFKLNPEAFPQFKKVGESYLEFIFQGDQTDTRAIGGKMFGELRRLPSESLGQFVKMAQETYGSKFGLPNPKEQVYAYVARMAMLGMEHPTGKLIRLPQAI
ncbi:MAG: hypothetical protein WAV46_02665 [Candidatus Moraniibacteriota bacterium]